MTRRTATEDPPVAAVADVALPEGDGAELKRAHAVFRRWLGESYDLLALDTVLATTAVERLGGDPVWLLVVSGSAMRRPRLWRR